jgi:hypothetical protein
MPDERYTVDGSDALEAKLADNCKVTLTGVKKLIPENALEGLLLAGGYGRGEGGVLRTPEGDKPYNDMEFYVFVKGNAFLAERKYRHALHELGEDLTPDAELEIEFKAITFAKLRKSPVNMFYYDLVMGHRWAQGDESLLKGCEHHRDATGIPLHEATRLLFNRCSGLLFSKARLKQNTFCREDADFIGRNCAKVQLAMGDALLAANGQYHWSCRERGKRLEALGDVLDEELMQKIRAHHSKGVKFKLYPERSDYTRDEIVDLHGTLTALAGEVWLALERKRLKANFRDAREYGVSGVNKCPETWAARNRLVNAKAFGLKSAFGKMANRYPRERLFNALALMLWMDDSDKDHRLLSTLKTNLRTQAESFEDLVKAYEAMWHLFN